MNGSRAKKRQEERKLSWREIAIDDLISAATQIRNDHHEGKRYVTISHDSLDRILQALEDIERSNGKDES